MSIFVPTRTRALAYAAAAAMSLAAGCGGAGSVAPTSATPALSGALSTQSVSFSQQADDMSAKHAPAYRKVVLGTKPLAYFPFDTTKEGSLVGGYTKSSFGGAKIAAGGAIESQKGDRFLSLANMAYATTSLSGGIPGTGSMVAWVNLSGLPSTAGHFFYVSGESQAGNDFDLQFETDNAVRFYTGGGENTAFSPPVSALVGKWNMLAVTYVGGANGSRNIYWNGAPATLYGGGVDAGAKSTQFNVGESLGFQGRYFQGGLDDVAVWDRALTAKEIAAFYKAAK